MNSSPLAAIWHWYPLLAWVACASFCSLPLGSLSYLNFYRKLRLDSNFSYGTGLAMAIQVYVGNLSPQTTQGAIRRLFQPYGYITSVHLMADNAGRPCGF